MSVTSRFPRNLGSGSLAVAGLALLAGAGLAAFSAWPHLEGDLAELGASPGLSRILAAGWYLAIVAMLAFAIVALDAAFRLLKARALTPAPLRIVAASLFVFGIGSFVTLGHDPHLLGFAVVAALFFVGSVAASANTDPVQR